MSTPSHRHTAPGRKPLPFRPRAIAKPRPRSLIRSSARSNVIPFPGTDWRRSSNRRFALEIAVVLAAVIVLNTLIVLVYSGVL